MNYQKIYNQIVEKAKKEYYLGLRTKNSSLYYEGHHIIPKCLGGTGKSWKWNEENIIPLTGKEHFIAHLLLHKIYPENIKIAQAFHAMCKLHKDNERFKPSASTYQYLKEIKAKIGFPVESRMKGVRTRKLNGSYKQTEEQKQKGIQTKIINGTINHTQHHKENITTSLKKLNSKLVKCDHCDKIGYISGMKTWHFENCRLREK
jgi:hypothetical protein